jgi:glycerol-3-phosphate dehydrogenase
VPQSPAPLPISLPALILGGGIAGLWTLDTLRRHNIPALLLEPNALGQGQSMWSQGIIHGGLKYTLTGILNPAAEAIREMPALWRECLAGTREPNLSSAKLRAEHCHLWHTQSLSSRLGMFGAKVGLRVAPVTLEPHERPEALRACPGSVARLDEQVIDVAAVLAALAQRNKGHILQTRGASITFDKHPTEVIVTLTPPSGSSLHTLHLRARHIILTAGAGNAPLRQALGLDPLACQLRPLHQVMLRGGELPILNGHCTDGAATRATITAAKDREGRTVWQVGGQIAERGVTMSPAELVAFAKSELAACLPGVDLGRAQWTTYKADRAEMKSQTGARPDDATILQEGRVITAWPTKLALAPRLAGKVLALVETPDQPPTELTPAHEWPAPPIATAPWDEPRDWTA